MNGLYVRVKYREGGMYVIYNETLDQYYTRLRSLSARCEFSDSDLEILAQIISNNGPAFRSHEFNQYMITMGIKHTTSTPLWPQGNSEVEAFMKTLGKAIRTANLERRPWRQSSYRHIDQHPI